MYNFKNSPAVTPQTTTSRAGEGAGREIGRKGRKMEKRKEGIGKGEDGEGEWGSPTHYFRLKGCTVLLSILEVCMFRATDQRQKHD